MVKSICLTFSYEANVCRCCTCIWLFYGRLGWLRVLLCVERELPMAIPIVLADPLATHHALHDTVLARVP